MSDDLRFDREHLWHPYSSMTQPLPMQKVVSAEGVRLTLENGRELIDGMASWWSAIHGYNHPQLNEAANSQLLNMSHVMFGGLTHQPAIDLGRLLLDITPRELNKIFYADSGSVSVEVALKMAIQYWHSQGKPGKHKFLAFMHGYHGDTFGAMSVTDPVNGMHRLFSGILPEHFFAAAPATPFGQACQPGDLEEVSSLLEEHASDIAAIIIEPIVQGAGGMRFYSADYLYGLRQLCDKHDVLLIADEIATGFGRTGELFACNHAAITPDILCLGKAITGGYLSFAATLCTDAIARGISEGEANVFMHGPTFMANPLACSIALKNIQLLLDTDWQLRIRHIENTLELELGKAAQLEGVKSTRVLGAIGVVELEEAVDMQEIQEMFVNAGVWVRPFGKLVYIMPPFIISDEDLQTLCRAIIAVLKQYLKNNN